MWRGWGVDRRDSASCSTGSSVLAAMCNKEQGSVIRNKEGLARNEEVPTSTTLKRILCQM
jgi:hypothetical protein